MEWFAENWHIAWSLFCLAVLVSVAIYYRRNPDASGAKIWFRIFPLGDPTGKTPTGFTDRAFKLWLFGLFILLMVYLFAPRYS
jgi:hypothetical protein